jgi:predicted GNAT family acetyltransferase
VEGKGDINMVVKTNFMHDDNSMGIVYTKEEHRGKGYAADATIDLASKIIKSGKIPYLQIIKSNSMSPGLAKKCRFLQCGHISWMGIIAGHKI